LRGEKPQARVDKRRVPKNEWKRTLLVVEHVFKYKADYARHWVPGFIIILFLKGLSSAVAGIPGAAFSMGEKKAWRSLLNTRLGTF